MKSLAHIRQDFPFLVHHPEITYLDSAATSLKPKSVLDAITRFYHHATANIHRSTHYIAEESTIAFEDAREKVAKFIGADTNEIIFTHNATYAFNLLASMLSLKPEDVVLGSVIEHHSNFLAWHGRARYEALPLDDQGDLDYTRLSPKILQKAKILVISHVSNVTGKQQDLQRILSWAKSQDLVTVVDASQAVSHLPIDVKYLDADYLIFSAHKMLGPSGVGVLYGKYARLLELTPCFMGGGMAQKITESDHYLKPIPHRFEPGTPNIENVIGLGAAVDYLNQLEWDHIRQHDKALTRHFVKEFSNIDGFHLLNEVTDGQVPIFSLIPNSPHIEVNQLARILSDRHQILVTAGKQCAHPYYRFRKREGGSIRISFGIYNSLAEVDKIVAALSEFGWLMPTHSSGHRRIAS